MISTDASGKPIVVRSTGTPARPSIAGCTAATARYLVCWYRNDRANWEWGEEARDARITCPALMVTAGRDPVLTPSLSAGMERVIPQLQRGRIEACGHWTQQECPRS